MFVKNLLGVLTRVVAGEPVAQPTVRVDQGKALRPFEASHQPTCNYLRHGDHLTLTAASLRGDRAV
jgi:hypothetical protein